MSIGLQWMAAGATACSTPADTAENTTPNISCAISDSAQFQSGFSPGRMPFIGRASIQE